MSTAKLKTLHYSCNSLKIKHKLFKFDNLKVIISLIKITEKSCHRALH